MCSSISCARRHVQSASAASTRASAQTTDELQVDQHNRIHRTQQHNQHTNNTNKTQATHSTQQPHKTTLKTQHTPRRCMLSSLCDMTARELSLASICKVSLTLISHHITSNHITRINHITSHHPHHSHHKHHSHHT